MTNWVSNLPPKQKGITQFEHRKLMHAAYTCYTQNNMIKRRMIHKIVYCWPQVTDRVSDMHVRGGYLVGFTSIVVTSKLEYACYI